MSLCGIWRSRSLGEIAQRGFDHLALIGRQRGLRRDGIADRIALDVEATLMQAARLNRAKASLIRHSLRCSAMASSQRAALQRL